MTRYLSLISYTDHGIREVKDSVNRAHAFQSLVEAAGGRVNATFWAVGEKDGAIIFEVPDEDTGAQMLLKLADQGFVRTQTMRVYDEPEFAAILAGV